MFHFPPLFVRLPIWHFIILPFLPFGLPPATSSSTSPFPLSLTLRPYIFTLSHFTFHLLWVLRLSSSLLFITTSFFYLLPHHLYSLSPVLRLFLLLFNPNLVLHFHILLPRTALNLYPLHLSNCPPIFQLSLPSSTSPYSSSSTSFCHLFFHIALYSRFIRYLIPTPPLFSFSSLSPPHIPSFTFPHHLHPFKFSRC